MLSEVRKDAACPLVGADTLIWTQRGPQRIDALPSGSKRLEPAGNGRFAEVYPLDCLVATPDGPVAATEAIYAGVRTVFDVRTDNGLRLRATPDDAVMALENGDPVWKTLRELSAGDYLVAKAPDRKWPPVRMQLPLAEIPNQSGWQYVVVVSVAALGVEPVYGLRVPGRLCFVAGGLVAHNCVRRKAE